jgi:hypothetical protein
MKSDNYSYFIYDGDCAFCARTTKLIAGPKPKFRILASQNAKNLLFENNVPYGITEKVAIWISYRGEVEYGPFAIAAALKQGNIFRKFLGVFINSYPVRKPAKVVYARIAKKRSLIGWNKASCALDGSNLEYKSSLFKDGPIRMYVLFQFLLPLILLLLRFPPFNKTLLYGWGWQMFS